MLYGIYRIDQILKCSGFAFGRPLDFKSLEGMSNYDLRYDSLKMYNMLSGIKEIIDKMIPEEDENINIDKLMADQEGEKQ